MQGIGKREDGCYFRLDFEGGSDEGIFTLLLHTILYKDDSHDENNMLYRDRASIVEKTALLVIDLNPVF